MLAKALRSFSTARKTLSQLDPSLPIANVKFPAGTVAGHFKTAVSANSERDIIRFDSQKLNWTLKEFDVSHTPHAT